MRRLLLAGALACAVVLAGSAADVADAKKRKSQRAAGIYVGTTNHIGSGPGSARKVTFRLTPDGTILGFRIADVRLSCHVDDRSGDLPYTDKVETLVAPPLSIGPVGRRLPQGRSFRHADPLPPPPPTFGPPPEPGSPPYRGVFVTGKSTVLSNRGPFSFGPSGRGFRGLANMATFSDTRGSVVTEECKAYTSLWDPEEAFPGFEWKAVKQVRKKPKKRAAGAAVTAAKKKPKCKKGKRRKCKKKRGAAKPAPPAGAGPPAPEPPPPPSASTEELIDAAVARGEITAEQGLTYKVFGAYSDPRLPSQYQGVPDPLAEAPLDEVAAGWEQLSEGAKATLGPFLIPPMHHGSYWQQLIGGVAPRATTASRASPRATDPDSPWCATSGDVALEDWSYLEALTGPAAGKVRIWYQDRLAATDAALAGDLLSAVEGKIWPALATLMQREPLPDFGSTGVCAGGSDALDIALVDAATATTTPTLRQENTPVHMVFPRTLPAGWTGFKPYLAHELMHAIQYSYTLASGDISSGENAWLKEGTAQWVQDYVSAGRYGVGVTPDQSEQLAIRHFLPNPEKSLDSTTPKHPYGSYLFWLWAARDGNDPSVVRQVWNGVASQKSLDAAKSLFGGGWAQAWKDFARGNWNKAPVTSYLASDGITDRAAIAAEGTLPGNEVTPVFTTAAPVAAKYLRFEPAPDATTLTYRNIGGLSDEAGVQAIIGYKDGSKAVEDWTQVAQQELPVCNIEELGLVLSNASVTEGDARLFNLSFSPPGAGGPRAAGRRAANVCLPDPQGTFSGSATYSDPATTMNWSWSGTVEFEPNGQMNPWFPEHFGEVWDAGTLASGSVTLSGSGTVDREDGDCTIDVPAATFQANPGDGTMIIQPGAAPHYGIQVGFPGDQFPQATVSCPDEPPQTGPFPGPSMMIYTPDPEQTSVRGSYQGSSTFSGSGFSSAYSWNLTDP